MSDRNETRGGETEDAFFWPGEILPRPKRADYAGPAVPLEPAGPARPSCVILAGEQAAGAELEAAAELSRRLESLDAGMRAAVRRGHILPEEPATVVVLGTPASSRLVQDLCRRERLRLTPADPGPEGYRIRFLERGRQTLILCAGSDAAGCYFGAQSLKQLAGVRGGRAVIRRAAVDDVPTYPFRGMDINSRAACPYFAAAKLNGWVVNQYHILHRWKRPPAAYRAYLRGLCREAPRHGARVLQVVNPLRSPGWEYDGAYKIRCSSKADIEAVYRTLCLSLEAGSRMVMLAFDDYTSRPNGPATEYILTHPGDRRQFRGDVGRAHAHVACAIHARLRREYPGVTLLVCPAYYSLPHGVLREAGETYLRTLGRALPPEVGIVWTGPGVLSPDLRREHADRFRALVGRPPFFWNNDLNVLHRRFLYLFDPFAAGYFKGLPARTGHGIMIDKHMEGRAKSGEVDDAPVKQVMRVALWQMADYMWNPEAYEPERSLRRALAAVAGPAAVTSLLRVRDLYWELGDRYAGLRSVSSPIPLDREAARLMQTRLADLAAAVTEAERRGAHPALTAELRDEWLAPAQKNAPLYLARQKPRPDLAEPRPYGLFFPAASFLGHMGSRYVEKFMFGESPADGYESGVPITTLNAWPCAASSRAARAVFHLKSRPGADALLSLRARLDDDPMTTSACDTPAALRIRINGRRIFRGAAGFRTDPFLVLVWPVGRTVFRRGRNELEIENITAHHQRVQVAWAKLVGIEPRVLTRRTAPAGP